MWSRGGELPGLIFWHWNGEFSNWIVKYSKEEPTQDRDLTLVCWKLLLVAAQLSATPTHRRELMIPISSIDPCTKCSQGFGLGLNVQQGQERSEFVQSQLDLTALLCWSHGYFWHKLELPGLTLCPAAVLQSPHSHGISFQCLWNRWHWDCEVRPVWVPEPKHLRFLFGYVSWSVNYLFFSFFRVK